jgi:hypothetical protein
MPKHEIKGLMFRFEQEPGQWGKWITVPTGGGGGGGNAKLQNREKQLVALGDRWIISKLQIAEKTVAENLDNYRLDLASQAIYSFVWDHNEKP